MHFFPVFHDFINFSFQLFLFILLFLFHLFMNEPSSNSERKNLTFFKLPADTKSENAIISHIGDQKQDKTVPIFLRLGKCGFFNEDVKKCKILIGDRPASTRASGRFQ